MPRQFGLIGKKLSHSFSKKYFTEKFSTLSIDAAYELFELAHINEFPSLLADIPELIGINVTIPYKSQVIPFLDVLSPEAAAVQAVNTIRIVGGKKMGFNTDIYGFQLSLMEWIPDLSMKSALILGTGGAAQAVAYVLEQKLNLNVQFVSRTPTQKGEISYQELTEIGLSDFPLIINTTPLGMYPAVDVCPAIPYESLTSNHYLYDLVYNPAETLFMQKGAQAGAQTQNGMRMLILQAEKAWEIWNQ